MVGTHWQGGGEVWFRTATESGTWSPWRLARPEEDDLPDATSDEGKASRGWNVGNPWWTGASTSIQYRVSGPVTRLRTFYISSEPSTADATLAGPATQATLRPDQPPITRRPGWGADESIVRAQPSFADSLELSVVHHTAGTNSYSAAQSAAIVRGIQRYHVLSNGWNDIGYNYLVDKYGRIFEGRGGGLIQNVIGAHAQGFNTGSVGVAVLGTYGRRHLHRGAQRAPAPTRLATRRRPCRPGLAPQLHVLRQRSLPRRPRGPPAGGLGTPRHRLHELSWHGALRAAGRDRLERLAHRPSEALRPRGRRFRGRPRPLHRPPLLGAGLARAGQGLGRRRGRARHGQRQGGRLDVECGLCPFASYTYEISAGPDTRPAAGPIPGPPPLAVTGLVVSPRVLTPNGDWMPSAPRSPSGSPGAPSLRSGS